MFNRLLILVSLLAVLAVGCYTHRFIVGSGAKAEGNPTYSHWHHHYLYGLVGVKELKITEICPSGNALVIDEISFVNGLIGGLTLGIYTPTNVDIYCAGGKKTATSVPLDPEQQKAIAMSPEFVDVVRDVEPAREQEVVAAQKYGPLAQTP